MEEAILNGVAFDGAGDGAVREARRLGRGGQGLPAHLEIKVNAGLQTQNEGELDVGFDGLALLVFLGGRGLHGENIVLKICAVWQRHGDCAACVDLAWGFIPSCEKCPGDDGILCVESGEIEAVRQGSVVQLREQDTLTDRLAGGADDGCRFRAVLVPCQGRAEVERRERQIFVRLSSFARFFAVLALIGVCIRANVGLGIVGLRGLLLWNSFMRRVLTGFGVGFFGVGLLDVALEVAFGVAVRTTAGCLYAVAAARAAGGLARLQNGDFLGFGLQDGVFRLG